MSVSAESTCRVVFHADDFGMNLAVNEGILTSFRDGLLTSTSLLANAPAAESACRAWPTLIASLNSRSLPSCEVRQQVGDPALPFDLGIHLNLTQGRPLTGERFPSELLSENGSFPGIGALFKRLNRVSPSNLRLVEIELHSQVQWMCDHGCRPTHANGHQYVELIPQISAMIPRILRQFAIPTVRVAFERGLFRNVLFQGDIAGWALSLVKRHYAKRFRSQMRHENVAFPDQFFGTSHAGKIDYRQVVRFLDQSRGIRCTEIGVHPAIEPSAEKISTNDPWFDPLAKLRPTELKWLCGTELADGLRHSGRSLGRLKSVGT